METIRYRIEGVEPLLLNNPQTVDVFNEYSKLKTVITNKKKKTDDDIIELRRLEVLSKTYFDENIGVYVPSKWMGAQIASNGWARVKIKKSDIRACVFSVEPKIKLHYTGMDKVKTVDDISNNPQFVKTMLLKQGQSKLAKCSPIFNDWHFESAIEFDPAMIDKTTLIRLMDYGAAYNGFGDFRPTYGRARFIDLSD